ncbi:MAG: glycine--tRNA ligase subunit beta [Rhodobacteraceae bacterium]|nr:glycine--tRNA ligase subunit beta [Paracoccaceae bacterium]
MPDLLIELFSEEIPARMQTRAAANLNKLVTEGLVDAGLTYVDAAAFVTPRRLTLAVGGLLATTPTLRKERKGPKVGAPDKAVEGFLRGAGISHNQLEKRDTPKGPVYFATIVKPGRPAAEIVAEVLERTVRRFPWPKSMRWGSGSLRWVRPLQSILCILKDQTGTKVVPLTIDELSSGNRTRGHRFMAPDPFSVTSFDDYRTKLKRAYVMLDAQERNSHIWNEATNLAFAAGLEVIEDQTLRAEVAGLVEWPVVLMGQIGADFLDLPPEVLQTSMKEHQKLFSVRNPRTRRIERFITVANRETVDAGETILAGNEKMLSARLSDAKFFWENDLRVASRDIDVWVQALEQVTFHNKLGSQGDRIRRIADLTKFLAPIVGANVDKSVEAAQLAKADLSSEMVHEFPELQGVMGHYYIRASGRDLSVAAAAKEHYSPLGPSDEVPTAPVSITVALADKLDTLTGFWAIDEQPTGSRDPFALRRAALGVLRLILDNDLMLDLQSIIGAHFARFEIDAVPRRTRNLLGFIHDRLKVYLRNQNIRHDIIDACIAMDGNDNLTLLVKRARALNDVITTEDGENLIQGFKRANNILTQAEEQDDVEYAFEYAFDTGSRCAGDPTEAHLLAALDAADAEITSALAVQDFPTAMVAMARLRGPIDAFFESVQINSEHATVRHNRLTLLSRIREICVRVADLTRIDG